MPKIMILFLYGQDTYRSTQKLNEIIERYKKIHKSGLNLIYFDGKNLKFQEFKDKFQQISMFKEKKLIILKNIFSNSKFKENFLIESQNFIDLKNVILICEREKISKRDSLFKFLKKNVKCQEFELLERGRLKTWARKEFAKYQIKIKSDALEELVDFIGNDLWRFSNEIKKLVNYKGKNSNSGISKEEVRLLVRAKIEPNIFKTIDFIASKNKKKALDLLHKHLEKGDSPLYLLSMINFQFRNLLTIKDLIERHQSPYLLSKKMNLHPYVIKKSYTQAQKFEVAELKKIYQKIFQVDLAIKTGKITPEIALDLLVAKI